MVPMGFVKSPPRMFMNLRRYLGFGAIAIAVVIIGLWSIQSPDYTDAALVEADAVDDTHPLKDSSVGGSYNKDGVAPFGMVQRLPKQLDGVAVVAVAAEAPGVEVVMADQNALFGVHCVACHGRDGLGIEPLGIGLVDSPFVQSKSTAELVEMLKVGRMPDSVDSVKGRVMPGFAWMGDDQLTEMAVFLKAQNP
jgi:mono/diheme cytochrome c family protein